MITIGSMNKRLPAHPGTVRFEDADRGTSNERPVSEVPEGIAFAQVGDSWVPVTRVIARLRGNSQVIDSYAADGSLLSTTLRVP
jgi:hypothetical protein